MEADIHLNKNSIIFAPFLFYFFVLTKRWAFGRGVHFFLYICSVNWVVGGPIVKKIFARWVCVYSYYRRLNGLFLWQKIKNHISYIVINKGYSTSCPTKLLGV
jgi:hypothetical protein